MKSIKSLQTENISFIVWDKICNSCTRYFTGEVDFLIASKVYHNRRVTIIETMRREIEKQVANTKKMTNVLFSSIVFGIVIFILGYCIFNLV